MKLHDRIWWFWWTVGLFPYLFVYPVFPFLNPFCWLLVLVGNQIFCLYCASYFKAIYRHIYCQNLKLSCLPLIQEGMKGETAE